MSTDLRGLVDWHAMNALHWGCTRAQAKQRSLAVMYAVWSVRDGVDPSFLDICHPDVRTWYLETRGIILGDS